MPLHKTYIACSDNTTSLNINILSPVQGSFNAKLERSPGLLYRMFMSLPCSVVTCSRLAAVRCHNCNCCWCSTHMPPMNLCTCMWPWNHLVTPDETDRLIMNIGMYRMHFFPEELSFHSLVNYEFRIIFTAWVCTRCRRHFMSETEARAHIRQVHPQQ